VQEQQLLWCSQPMTCRFAVLQNIVIEWKSFPNIIKVVQSSSVSLVSHVSLNDTAGRHAERMRHVPTRHPLHHLLALIRDANNVCDAAAAR
jgi:hypothetical protein